MGGRVDSGGGDMESQASLIIAAAGGAPPLDIASLSTDGGEGQPGTWPGTVDEDRSEEDDFQSAREEASRMSLE